MLPQHPEWVQAVNQIIEPHTAGLPQDENVVWISMTKTQMQTELSRAGYQVSRYHVKQILDSLDLKERSFRKDLPMKEVEDRNEQFENIASHRRSAQEAGIPVCTPWHL